MSQHDPTGTDLHDRNGSHLEALLREDAQPIAENGFTERVMTALPPRAAVSRWRPWILACSALVATLVGGYVLSGLSMPVALPWDPSRVGERLVDWLFVAFTWAPEGMPMPLPLVPLVLGLLSLALSVLGTRASLAE